MSAAAKYGFHLTDMMNDGLIVREVIEGIDDGKVIEEYADYPKGPCVLALQKAADDSPIHAVWGIPRDADGPAVLVTAYRPDPERWTEGFEVRRR